MHCNAPQNKLPADCQQLSRVREHTLERILVNYRGHGLSGSFAKAADDPACAVHQDICISTQNGSRQDNAEPDDGADGYLSVHVEQDAACGNVGGFSEVLVGVACSNGDGKL
jgi:hypothetical protein